MASNQLVTPNVGSTDWAGGVAPAGGSHSGTSTITMQDGTQYVVAHNRAEVLRKRDLHAIGQTSPTWVAFDSPSSPAVPLVLNLANFQSVT